MMNTDGVIKVGRHDKHWVWEEGVLLEGGGGENVNVGEGNRGMDQRM